MARTGVLTTAVRVEPSAADRTAATAVLAARRGGRGRAKVVLGDGTTVMLSPALLAVLQATAGELADGHAVTVLPSDAMLTPAEAAELLGLSRPFVVRLLDEGEIPAQRLPRSRHRRIRLADVLAFQDQRDRRGEGRRRIAADVEAAGLPY
ncbi:MAG: helix-turn-helix domain-containing protein [Acidimicrobiales bacterium]